MRGESMKDKSKKSTYSTTFGVDPKFFKTDEFFIIIKPICKDQKKVKFF